MKVVIFAFCVNIAIVNAVQVRSLDLRHFVDLINKGRRSMISNTTGSNDTDEALALMPGFYLEKPKELTLEQFINPKEYLNSFQDITRSKLRTLEPEIGGSDDLKAYERDVQNKNADMEPNIIIDSKDLKETVIKAIKENNNLRYGEDSSDEQRLNSGSGTRSDDLLLDILRAFKISNRDRTKKRRPPSVILIDGRSSQKKSRLPQPIKDFLNEKLNVKSYDEQSDESENFGGELIDEDEDGSSAFSSEEVADSLSKYIVQRRSNRKKNDKKRTRSGEYSSSTPDDDSKSGSTENEKNPGNPFTIHKNKYKQNWVWNHYMDGDHMNINPLGPQFSNQGPSGADIFYGRKWWYFNQDDYKPMG